MHEAHTAYISHPIIDRSLTGLLFSYFQRQHVLFISIEKKVPSLSSHPIVPVFTDLPTLTMLKMEARWLNAEIVNIAGNVQLFGFFLSINHNILVSNPREITEIFQYVFCDF